MTSRPDQEPAVVCMPGWRHIAWLSLRSGPARRTNRQPGTELNLGRDNSVEREQAGETQRLLRRSSSLAGLVDEQGCSRSISDSNHGLKIGSRRSIRVHFITPSGQFLRGSALMTVALRSATEAAALPSAPADPAGATRPRVRGSSYSSATRSSTSAEQPTRFCPDQDGNEFMEIVERDFRIWRGK